MKNFIDVDNYDTPNKDRNLVNVAHIIRIERTTPGDEGSPVNIHLIDGTVIYSKTPFYKFYKVLDSKGL